MQTAAQIKKELFSLSDPQKKEVLPSFFKTGKGEYGEGDKFIGVAVPQQRELVTKHKDLLLSEIEILLQDVYHECRLTALLFLVEMFRKERSEVVRKHFFDFYIEHHPYINNWDLVDLSAPKIVGEYLLHKDRSVLKKWAKSDSLWLQRIAIVSTYAFIRHNELEDTFSIAEILLHHPHDLIQKAVGWMLREAGKRDFEAEKDFLLHKHRYQNMPRTMLRYAIEKFPEELRQQFLKGKV